MKRSGPLKRKTALQTRATLRRAPLEGRGRLRQQSDKGKRDEAEFRSVRHVVIERDQGRCRRCGRTGHHVHHVRRRKGRDRHDPRWLVLLCFQCHDWVHGNPAEAKREGWLA